MTGSPLTEAEFVRRLQGLSADAFESFVAELWAARGWDVERVDGRLRLSRDPNDDEQQTVVVEGALGDGPDALAGIDTVVARSTGARRGASWDGPDMTHLDPGDLYRTSLYAIDREEADELFRRYFDRGLTSPESPPEETAGRSTRDPAGTAPWLGGRRQVVLAATTVVLIGIAFVVGAAGGSLAGLAGGDVSTAGATVTPSDAPPEATPAPIPTDAATRGAPVTSTRAPQPRYLDLHPTCERPPGAVVSVILGILRHGNQTTDEAIRAAWRFSTKPPLSANRYKYFVEFLRQDKYAPLFTYRSIEYGPVVRHTRTVVSQRVTVRRGGRQAEFEFVLSKSDRPRSEGCWQLSGIAAKTGR